MEQKIRTLMAVAPDSRDPQWLKDSLQAAIELELSTLPPYLCAMWSIRDRTVAPGLQAYQLIDSVVKQEMTHMGLVCNMLTAIGGTPQIAQGYANFISYPGPLPGGVRPALTVMLSGLTKPLVHDVFMQIEFPDGGPIKFAHLAGETFPTIGAFYDAIQDAFNQLAPPLSTAGQIPSPGVKVTIIQNPDDVKTAISLIKVQGEGTKQSPDDAANSTELAHYYRFAELYVGMGLVAQPGGGFAFNGPPIPFPDTFTMAPIPQGGYRNPSPAAQAALDAFDNLFSDLLDQLDTAWSTGSQPALTAAVGDMVKLSGAALPLFSIPLPSPEDGFYGPDFKYVAKAQRKPAAAPPPVTPTAPGPEAPTPPAAPPAPGPAAPTFADIVALLQALTGNDPNLDAGSPHGAFWTQPYAAFMAQTTDDWGVPGNLVVKGDPTTSNLFLALAGTGPFAGLRMPSPNDPNSRFATPTELQLVSTWISNGCPQ